LSGSIPARYYHGFPGICSEGFVPGSRVATGEGFAGTGSGGFAFPADVFVDGDDK